MSKVTEWKKYKKGDIINHGFKIERIQLKIDGHYFINNFVDKVMEDSSILNGLDKILLKGDGNPIALYPYSDEDIRAIIIYLESIKDTDITTLYISMGDNYTGFLDTEYLEQIAQSIKAVAKFSIRYFLRD